MKMNALNGHESVGIMPQAAAAWAVPEPLERYFLPAVGQSPRTVGQLMRQTGKVPAVITYEDCSNGD
ncbi:MULTISPECIES: hypothetical protein [Pseudomonas]|uniref:hypothetical protein n=1 Tax=Pseudomonas TaxID=286 RepID=UPI001BE8AB1D|nr:MULTISPECIES: hypothetical protein [Pseudomonas]MBT2342174.1 hypothetical protein [Pseudomonas fluorescens]MCD4530073.1 hypothetical protein [Pseudomonas sp. C3-2018]